MAQLIVTVIFELPETFTLGVYSSLAEAKEDYFRIMRDQAGFPKLSLMFEREFGFPLIGLDNAAFDQLLDDVDTGDFLSNKLYVYFEPVTPGTLFYFLDWRNWNDRNLYHTLDMVLRGQTGRLRLRQDPHHLFLNSVGAEAPFPS